MSYAATIGFFDGVHLGHRFVLDNLRRVARENGLESAVLTFTEHPQLVLRGKSVRLLTTYDERIALLKAQGVNQIFAFRFDVICGMTAEEFMSVLKTQCDVEILLMGYDHRFGSDRLTRFEDYQAAAKRTGIQLVLLDALKMPKDGDASLLSPSSTKIRQALTDGEIEEANRMLGYDYTLTGEVVEGRQIGRQIGYPTANLMLPDDKMLPAAGVYAAEVESANQQEYPLAARPAILNIGSNPTVDGKEVTVELHIPGFEGDLYGEDLRVRLLHYIRQEQRFDSLDALREQITKDVQHLNTYGD